MSSMSLEERRAERRRRRQMEEENFYGGTKTADEIHADIQERLARRRKERDERMANIAASVATVNGEDDLERRRRERREQRLRASGDTDYTSTDDYSSRRNRRRGTDDNDNTAEDTYSFSSYRSRRERNYNEEETPTVNDDPVPTVPDTSEEEAAEERRRKQREEEEEEARLQEEREAEKERERQAALEEERREREARRRQEEEEERRRQEEEEEERRRNDAADIESGSEGSTEEDRDRTENKLFIEEDDIVKNEYPVDKYERVRQWNEGSNNVDNVLRQKSDNVWHKRSTEIPKTNENSQSVNRSSSMKEINNNKIKDKLNKFEHLQEEGDTKIVKDKALLFVDKEGLKGKLQKFEKEIKDQETSVKEHRQPSHAVKLELLTPQPHKLTAKLQQFEIAAKSQSASKPSPTTTQFELEKQRQRHSILGRWSASETHICQTAEGKEKVKRNVLDRWKSVATQQQNSSSVTSPKERKEVLEKRLSGNTEFISSRFLEKASKSVDDTVIPKVPNSLQRSSFTCSSDERKFSQSSETQSDISEDSTHYHSKTKVTCRWQHNSSEASEESPVKYSRGNVIDRWPFKGGDETVSAVTIQTVNQGKSGHNRESTSDRTCSNSSTASSVDGLSQTSRRSSYHNQKEEEEEEEEERRRQEKEARMGAEDGQKKRGKRKGLGGLTPEKKKKLKELIGDVSYTEEEWEEKEHEMNKRVQPLPADLDFLSSAELRKLIKGLHDKLAQIHSEAYDIEIKLNKQEKELIDLNMKISDSRGKFAKPVLRKVNKTEQKFAKMSKKVEPKDDFRETLKSAHDDDEGAE